MANDRLEPGDLEVGLLGLFPPSLRASILEDRDFCDRAGVRVDATIQFDQADTSFQRSALFVAIRELLANKQQSKELNDIKGKKWVFSFDDERKRVRIACDVRQFFMPDFNYLSADSKERLAWFDHEIERYHVSDIRTDAWRAILSERELEDEEVEALLSEFRLTPLHVAASIAEQLHKQKIDASSLVPPDLRYYDRLVGEPSTEDTLRSFVDSVIAPRVKSLLKRGGIGGLKDALLMSSHPWITQAIAIDGVPCDKLLEFYQWLETNGDRFSQLGGIEFGLLNLEHLPEIEPILGRIVQQMLADRPDDENGRLSLVCSLIVLVEGELARTGICRQRPPFWRRLASIAHASVLERAIVESGMLASDFNEWAMKSRGQMYYMQTFVDMKKEPRWNPDFILPDQLRAEFVGRIAGVGEPNLEKIKAQDVRQLIDGEDTSSARSQLVFPFSYLPGPLEGGIATNTEMPSDAESNLRNDLEAVELTPKSFASLVNSALIFRIDQPLAKLAAEGLRRVKHQLRQITSQNEAFSLLIGLATVAAVTRSDDLADEVKMLMRAVRRKPGINITQDNALRIALVAAAAHADVSKWCKFVGEWLNELAFEDMSISDARSLRQHILVLRQLEPRLWQTTARADAATSAFIESSPA